MLLKFPSRQVTTNCTPLAVKLWVTASHFFDILFWVNAVRQYSHHIHNRETDVAVTIYTQKQTKLTKADVKNFNAQYPTLKLFSIYKICPFLATVCLTAGL